ncbi:LytTR family transcriptional regulator DNA-binding domain-containing protein [Paenibacillus sp. NRS-1781]|uniref:LytTR family transcriptional regulator DNA-binding domain-containing protein n=1 Tax=Paenibacillus sp. NRS-1781 TaxID=3233905 RepID=UPI003D2CC5DC
MISVTKELDAGLIVIPVPDICYGEYDSSIERIKIHTHKHTFYTTGSLIYWTTILNNSGYNFHKADRYHMINVDNIVEMDSKLRYVYFDEQPTEDSVVCKMAYHKFIKVSQELLKLNSRIVLT